MRLSDTVKTVLGGTMTSEGFFHNIQKNGFEMPVALDTWKDMPVCELKQYLAPKRDRVNRELFYVTPGGRHVRA